MILKIFIFAVAISAVHVVSAGQFNLDRLLFGSVSLDNYKGNLKSSRDSSCVENGYTCIGCDTSRFCFQVAPGIWIEEYFDCIAQSQTCTRISGECVDDNPECGELIKNYKFVCQMIGLYPDLSDCTKYNLCLNDENGKIIPEPTEFKCNSGFEYDSLTTLCSIKMDDPGFCLGPRVDITECKSFGERGAVIGNPNMFYMCVYINIDENRHLLPQLFNCAGGFKFINGECRNPNPPKPDLNEDKTCEMTKNYHNPGSCTDYIKCIEDESPETIPCDDGKYFDVWKDDTECIDFVCNP